MNRPDDSNLLLLMNRTLRALAALLTLCSAGGARAQNAAFTSGTYVTADGMYAIQVTTDGANLTVVEPNKTSVYAPAGPGVYHFTNPTNGIAYGLRVIDAQTLEAFKPGSAAAPTRLALRAPGAPGATDASDPYTAMAMRYEERSRSDSDNAHVWTACAAAAMARATSEEAGFRDFTLQLVQMLKPIMVNPTSTPCEDAIPDVLWRSVP
jgi:hypothetical protein